MKLIAELSMNHMGDMTLAREMIKAAQESGADYAKFQTWKCSNLKSGPWDSDGRREIYQQSEMTEGRHADLKSYCDEVGIRFLTSCFNSNDLPMIRQFCDDIKIPSPECTNYELVARASEMFDNVYVSIGAANLEEVRGYGRFPNVTLLHCVSCYPCPGGQNQPSEIRGPKNSNGQGGL